MLNNEQLDLLVNLCNLSFSIFSVGVTLLTVLISFIIIKKGELEVYNSLLKKEDHDVTLRSKINSARKYIIMLRKFTLHVIIIIFLSILIYSVFWLNIVIEPNICMFHLVVGFSFVTVVYIVLLLIITTLFYWKYTNI